MPAKHDFPATFAALRAILQPYAPRLTVTKDTPDCYYLDGGYSQQWKKVIFFGATTINKSYVSFHLIAVYACPDLVKGLSDGLRARMQGKSCFNFKTITPGQAEELKELTRRGFEAFERLGWLDKQDDRRSRPRARTKRGAG
jgi:hypothetical protein